MCVYACLCACSCAHACVRLRVCVCVCQTHLPVRVPVCVSVYWCAYECLRLALLSTICSQESDKRHGLSPTTSGVCSCLFGSGTFWLHTMMFETFTCMGIFMSICICVYSGVCLRRCMYMSRTHNAHTPAHTTHTTHNNEFFHTTLLSPNLFQSWTQTSELLGRISTSKLDPHSVYFV